MNENKEVKKPTGKQIGKLHVSDSILNLPYPAFVKYWDDSHKKSKITGKEAAKQLGIESPK
jgi:hypothetical protein